MSQWNVKASTLVILSCVTFLMLLIVVLPDVDLPDTAFHRNTAPAVVHAAATAAPAAVMIGAIFQVPASVRAFRPIRVQGTVAVIADPNFRPILLRSIRC